MISVTPNLMAAYEAVLALFPDEDCDCGEYTVASHYPEHLVATDCCDLFRPQCETVTVLDGAGDPDVRVCRHKMGCDVEGTI